MPKHHSIMTIEGFNSFGELLRYLRERAHLSQRELAAQVGYHYSYISYLEKNLRVTDEAVLLGRFVPALGLEDEPKVVERLLELAAHKHRRSPSSPDVQSDQPAPGGQLISQMPATFTHMLGRDREAALLEEILGRPQVRLVTIVGPPGVGKTRLALHIAGQAQKTFSDGAIFVDLTAVNHAELVIPAIASALGVREPISRNIRPALREKNLLMVLDNFEQVVEAAPCLTQLLADAARVKILVTSREVLAIRGEQQFPLAPLSLPEGAVLESPAVQLFFERARAVKPTFPIDEATAACVAEICRHLDGLPLAIELAAARVSTMSLANMVAQFDRRFEWLTNSGRDRSIWQRTLWGAINWSYALLSGQERALLNRLSVFAGGWTLEAAEAVCCDQVLCAHSDILTLTMQLVDKSLVQAESDGTRYGFLETLREFAHGKLKESSDYERTRQLHFEYYLEFARLARPHLEKGSEQELWLGRIECEYNNLRAALAWAAESPERAPLALELGRALHPFWSMRGYISEARLWLDKILSLDSSMSLTRADLLRFDGDYASIQGDYGRALDLEQQGLKISEALGDEAGLYSAMEGMAMLAGMQGDYKHAAELLEKVLLYRRQTGDQLRLTPALNNLAIAARRMGDLERARLLLSESVEVSRNISNNGSLAHALTGLAELHAAMKDYAAAVKFQRESISIRHKLGSLKGLVFSFDSLAVSLDGLGEHLRAVQLESASDKLRLELGIGVSPAVQKEKDDFIAHLRERLGGSDFEKAWKHGQELSMEEAVSLALQEQDGPGD